MYIHLFLTKILSFFSLSFALLLGVQMGAVCLKSPSETGRMLCALPLAVSFSHRSLLLSLSRGRFPASPIRPARAARLRQDFRARGVLKVCESDDEQL